MPKFGGAIIVVSHTVNLLAALSGVIGSFLGFEQQYEHKVIEAGRIYSSIDVGRLLHIERREVIGLIRRGILDARKGSDGNYRITGQAIMKYMAGQPPTAQVADLEKKLGATPEATS